MLQRQTDVQNTVQTPLKNCYIFISYYNLKCQHLLITTFCHEATKFTTLQHFDKNVLFPL